jgi:hypothetical protein
MTPTPIGSQTTAFLIIPTAPAEYPINSIDLWIIKVLTPLPNIPQHIVDTPCIRLFQPNVMGTSFRIPCIPSNLIKLTISHFPGIRPANILPLGFTRETKSIRALIDISALTRHKVRGP